MRRLKEQIRMATAARKKLEFQPVVEDKIKVVPKRYNDKER